jgi:hypothetical protein
LIADDSERFEAIVARRGLGSLKAWCTASDNFELKRLGRLGHLGRLGRGRKTPWNMGKTWGKTMENLVKIGKICETPGENGELM